MTEIKARKPIVALLLSVLSPGLGQLYNGDWLKGVCLNIVMMSGFTGAFVLLPKISQTPIAVMGSFIVGLVILGGLSIYAAVESYRIAKISTEFRPNKYNKWYVYLLFFLVSGALISIARDNVFLKAYRMPAVSMDPTLVVGDHIYVNKLAYTNESPKRGDVIVFEFPEDKKKDFIKRIIGIPGDNVEVKNKEIILNGHMLKEKNINHDNDEGINNRDNMNSIIVPEGKYFVMGDNRNRSYDSRFWGCLNKEAIKGKAIFIYYSKRIDRILTKIQ